IPARPTTVGSSGVCAVQRWFERWRRSKPTTPPLTHQQLQRPDPAVTTLSAGSCVDVRRSRVRRSHQRTACSWWIWCLPSCSTCNCRIRIRSGTEERRDAMARYAAFLRGVMPTNARMPALKACFEAAGFDDVKTLLSSGNVVFATRSTSEKSLERRIEAAIRDHLGQEFMTIVRAEGALHMILGSDPYKGFRLGPDAKRV